jgi:hypothetical protein
MGIFDCEDIDIIIQNNSNVRFHPYRSLNNNYANDFGVTINAKSLDIQSGSKISADGLGYLGGNGTNNLASSIHSGFGLGGGLGGINTTGFAGNGASYGGMGGIGVPAGTPMQYGSIPQPNNIGSGGGQRLGWGPGGNGGGNIKLNIINALIINGNITTNGQNSPGGVSGGGSGGTINITSGSMTGSGIISANGGNGGATSPFGGAGGGGRIMVQYNSSTFTGDISANGGTFPTTRLGENGSVIIKNNTSKTLYIQNTQRWVPENANSFEEWFPDIERVIVCSSTSIDPECVNGTNAILSLDTINKNTLDQGVPWIIKLQDMYIDSNSEINLSEFGYLGSSTAANGFGPGGGGGSTGFSTGGSGGSYGGKGGDGLATVALNIYGSIIEPNQLGSGGGRGRDSNGVSGGGAIKLEIGNELKLNGSIRANGTSVGVTRGGAGSGGSIWIITKELTGNGNMSANGGDGGTSGDVGGAGGGGRIMVQYNSSTFTGDISANGGAHSCH